jgi:N-methylhydantoinase A
MKLDVAAARRAIETHIARPMGLTIEEAAAGMYRVACNNMGQGVREVTIKRGFDPREFPFIAAGGAGPIHSCLICSELAIPLQIVPWSSSVLCAFGMLLSDLRHDFVRTFVSRIDDLDWASLDATIAQMRTEGDRLLDEERVPPERRDFVVRFDCRYVKQYHEVSVAVPRIAIEQGSTAEVAAAFHAEHRRLYGYSLEAERTPIELINVRLQAIGATEKAAYAGDPHAGLDGSHALKGARAVYIPETKKFERVPIYDGHRLRHGARIVGPALIESVTTAIFVSADYDGVVDRYRSFVVYLKGHDHLVSSCLRAEPEKAFA